VKYLFFALILTGCALIPPQPYDNVLYDKYVSATIVVFNTVPKCNDPKIVVQELQNVLVKLDEALLYEKYRNEPKLLEATTLIRDDLKQLLTAYEKEPVPTEGYCRLKLQIAEVSLNNTVEAIGGKPQ